MGTTLLSSHVSVYVPSTLFNRPVDNSHVLKSVRYKMSEIFGGCTTHKVMGGYIANDGSYIEEYIFICKSFTPAQLSEVHIDAINKLAEIIKNELQQESVAVEIGGGMTFL